MPNYSSYTSKLVGVQWQWLTREELAQLFPPKDSVQVLRPHIPVRESAPPNKPAYTRMLKRWAR